MSPLSPIHSARWFAPGSRLRLVAQGLRHPYLAYLLIALVVWWPAGFNIGPVTDGWVDITSLQFFPNRLLARYLENFPHALGMRLTPGSFVGWQLVLLASIVLRGILTFEVVKRLVPRQGYFAMACGALAMFHPADDVYFWVDWTNVDVAWVLALAACLATLRYLSTGSLMALILLWLLQLSCCFMYTSGPLVLLAFPFLAWLLRRVEGVRLPVIRLPGSIVGVILFIVYLVFEATHGVRREGQVWDPNVLRTLDGFWVEFKSIFQPVIIGLRNEPPAYLIYGMVTAAVVYVLAGAESALGSSAPSRWRIYAAVCAGFVILAIAAYFPYAITRVRYGNQRQLLGAGLFIYAALLLPLFVFLSERPRGIGISRLAVAVLAGYVTVLGLADRTWNVSAYRSEEGVLAAIATVLPRPAPATSVIVKFDKDVNPRFVAGFYGRAEAFTQALWLMYGDSSLSGGFIDMSSAAPFDFHAGSIDIAQTGRFGHPPPPIPYKDLVLVNYHADGTAQILDRGWLQQQAPKGTNLSGYAPATVAAGPAAQAHICSLLENDKHPAYCG